MQSYFTGQVPFKVKETCEVKSGSVNKDIKLWSFSSNENKTF